MLHLSACFFVFVCSCVFYVCLLFFCSALLSALKCDSVFLCSMLLQRYFTVLYIVL